MSLHRIISVQQILTDRLFDTHQQLERVALVDHRQPDANRDELISIGRQIISLRRQWRVWNRYASGFRDTAQTAPNISDTDFLHEIIKITAAIESVSNRYRQLAIDFRAVQQKRDDVKALNLSRRSYRIALAGLGVSLLFGVASTLAMFGAFPVWWTVGGIAWGCAAGFFGAHYWLGVYF